MLIFNIYAYYRAGRTERLITPTMWRNMVCGAIYQLCVLLVILFAGESIWDLPPVIDPETNRSPNAKYTLIFNTFVLFQLFNEINCRESGNRISFNFIISR